MSYANVAANGSSPKPDNATLVSGVSPAPASAEGSSESQNQTTASETSEASTTAGSSASEAAPAKKEKKALAPAPVPTKSVWGASAATNAATVDEQKWPTPDKAPALLPVGQNANKAATKFIKPNKWVPINAKVVLPSPRSQGAGAGQQKAKRKNKNNRKKSAGMEEDKRDEKLKKDDLDEDVAESTESLKDQTPGHDQLGDASFQDRKRYSTGTAPAQSPGQHKLNRKFPQGPVQNGKPAQNSRQQNGYYQSYGANQGYNNFNGHRQYRPNNGQYRRNNSSGNLQNTYPNGYRGPMGMPFVPHIPHHPMPQGMIPGMPYGAPMPVQIPPPISPKQEPLQALTQQIDYYFSLENLLRDIFLRKNMGTEGWIDLDIILSFKRVKIITNGILNSFDVADEEKKAELLDQTILAAVQRCQNVELGYLNGKDSNNATATEVQLRVKNNFEQWLLPDNVQL